MKQVSEDSTRWREEGSLARDIAPGNTTVVSSLDFLFALYIPDLGLVKPATSVCQWAQENIKPVPLIRGIEKRNASK